MRSPVFQEKVNRGDTAELTGRQTVITKKTSPVFFQKKIGVIPLVAVAGDTNPSDATAAKWPITRRQASRVTSAALPVRQVRLKTVSPVAYCSTSCRRLNCMVCSSVRPINNFHDCTLYIHTVHCEPVTIYHICCI